MARKLTNLQKEYRKERNRIRNFLKKLENRGYLETEGILPDQPKRITRSSINRLKKLTSEQIYKKVKFLDTETGVVTSGARGRDIERSRSAKKAAETRKQKKKAEEAFWTGVESSEIPEADVVDGGEIIYGNIVEEILLKLSQPIEEEAYTFYYGKKRRRKRTIYELAEKRRKELVAIINSYVLKYGKSEIGWRIHQHSDEIDMLINGLLYASVQEVIEFSFSRLVEIIKGGSLSLAEQETINSVEESMEDWSSYE